MTLEEEEGESDGVVDLGNSVSSAAAFLCFVHSLEGGEVLLW